MLYYIAAAALFLYAASRQCHCCRQPRPVSDHEWVLSKYVNFRGHVRGLVAQEPKLLEWADWLDKLPLSIFLAGGDGELKGVRGAADDDRRAAEAGLVLERWALDYEFQLERISDADKEKLRRYISLFSIA